MGAEWVAQTNGQRVTGVGTDTRFEPPARQLWSTAENPQLAVSVRQVGSAEDARAVADWAAPVDATLPGGWDAGGEVPGRIGAAYTVSKGPVAVAVFTNQNESVKAEAVGREVITTLAL